jgi:hypothetical protein
MSWLFSQVLVEEYLGGNSLDGEQSVQSSGNPTQQAYCAPDKMMDFSRLSRFGMTYKPLTADLGAELLTLYLEDFHAQTLAQQEKAQESMEKTQDSGEKWRGSFVKYSPDLHLWKTHQCSLLGDLDEFLETWPQWGLMRDGECWEQQTLAQTISATAFGLLLNPMENQLPPPPHTLAYADSTYEQRNERTERTQAQHTNPDGTSELAHTENSGDVWRNWVLGFAQEEHNHRRGQSNGRREWWQAEPNVGRVADGVACRVDRLKAIGNGQVPLCAATAFRLLVKDI